MDMCHFYGISAHCGQLSVSYNVQNLVNLKKVHKIDPFWPKEGSHKIECQILHLYDFGMACFHLGFKVTNKIMVCTSNTKQVKSFLPIPAKCIVFNFTLSNWENRLPALSQLTASFFAMHLHECYPIFIFYARQVVHLQEHSEKDTCRHQQLVCELTWLVLASSGHARSIGK